METRRISPRDLIFPPADDALRPPPSPEDKDWDEVFLPLKQDIADNGLLNLFSVSAEDGGKYMVLDGSRRATVTKLLCEEGHPDFQEITVQVTEAAELDRLERQFSGNANVAPTKSGQFVNSLQRLLIGRGYSTDELARRVGKSKQYVEQLLKVNKLPESVRKALDANELTLVNAVILTKLPGEADVEEYLADACAKTQEEFAAQLAEVQKDAAAQRKAAREGKKVEFKAEEKYVKKDVAKINLERARTLCDVDPTEFNQGYLLAYQEIFQVDEKSIQEAKQVWEKKMADAEKKKAERAKQRSADKKKKAIEFLKSEGITDLSEIEAD